MRRSTPLRRDTPASRAWIEKPRKPLPRSAEMERGGPVRKRNEKRAKAKFARNFGSTARVRWMKSRRCVFCGCRPSEGNPIQCAHLHARGMGGCGGDVTSTVPACKRCHGQYDSACRSALLDLTGWTMEELERTALEYEAMWQRELGDFMEAL